MSHRMKDAIRLVFNRLATQRVRLKSVYAKIIILMKDCLIIVIAKKVKELKQNEVDKSQLYKEEIQNHVKTRV